MTRESDTTFSRKIISSSFLNSTLLKAYISQQLISACILECTNETILLQVEGIRNNNADNIDFLMKKDANMNTQD